MNKSDIYKTTGSNDNPSAEEFRSIFRKLLVCKEIVYRNNYGNCISNDTGILMVSSARPVHQRTATNTLRIGRILEIELNFEEVIQENIGKFDEHSCAFNASTIEDKLIQTMNRCHKKYCVECIQVFEENEKANDEFLKLKNETSKVRMPCISTVHIIKVTNKLCELLNVCGTMHCDNMYESVLKTVMQNLEIEKLYTNSNFAIHIKKEASLLSHKDEFIYKVVDEYMTLKSRRIGARISEEKQGKYIRHNNKTRTHEAGQ